MTLILGFRYLPGMEDFLYHKMRLPKLNLDLISFRNELGFTMSKIKLSELANIRLNKTHLSFYDYYNKVLVEAVTNKNGYYGRFIILVQLGVGCTVWYGFGAGGDNLFPANETFKPIDSYQPFIDQPDTHVQPGFEKMTLAQSEEEIYSKMNKVFQENIPFKDINIPDLETKNHTFIAVALGLTVVVLMALGVSPTVDEVALC